MCDTPRVAYRVPEAALALALSEAKVWQLVKAGDIRSFTVGAARRIPATALDEFVEQRTAARGAHHRTEGTPGE